MLKKIVINTSPIIALFSAFDDLSFLNELYSEIIVPLEVKNELLYGNAEYFGAKLFLQSKVFTILEEPQKIMPLLIKTLDIGEASVIQTAINKNIDTVCIDEVSGRRIAGLSDLKVTGSLGVIIKAIKNGLDADIQEIIHKMRSNGIWISDDLEQTAISLVHKE
ncbi:MAG TPA: DUF3368 domain-containing protein [Candidatus Cloacimonadota bacterium]|jgi:predicted nucleic acid-binding protein|nr:DUF3368 domain-containing protein [Candidatus Cloacimonadota bacterium]